MLKQILHLLKTNKEFYNSVREDFTYHSSVIEGSTVTREQHHELASANDATVKDVINNQASNKEDAIENLNCLKLFDYVFDNIDEPLSHNEICKYQLLLKKNTSFAKNVPQETGKYRTSDVKVGNHYPPPNYKVHELMDNLIKNFQLRKILLIDDIAQFHIEFERIHPFRDGNGRIGRMIAFKQCLSNNVIPFIVNQETRKTYINSLEYFQHNNDYSILTKYFLEQQKTFLMKYDEYLHPHKELSSNESKVIEYLRSNKYANRSELESILGLKIAATKNLLSKMVKNKLIKIVGGSKNSKYSVVN
ncbi:MAG: Fic family protein [Mycoplasmataceae bacterium]|jgi:Fic family protein|nr:Fic family protein [Mycoplasmataceae bacterium]